MAIRSGARLVNVGHGNVVVAEQIVALDSLVTESDHLILSSLEPATLAQRLTSERGPSD